MRASPERAVDALVDVRAAALALAEAVRYIAVEAAYEVAPYWASVADALAALAEALASALGGCEATALTASGAHSAQARREKGLE